MQNVSDAKIVGEPPKRLRTDILRRQAPKREATPATLIAYDFETTRIKVGTPQPLYITAYHEKLNFSLEMAIKGMGHLKWILETYFLVPEFVGCKFVAWNANNFDVYFVAAALVTDPEWTMRPYMTGTKTIRGLKVMRSGTLDDKDAPAWEFVDGMAQLGLVGVSLEKFLKSFAPDYAKLKGNIDFEREEFDPTNQKHCDYAMRDSVGLYHGINYAQSIILERFNQPLRVTMGAVCIRILTANIPEGIRIIKPDPVLRQIIRHHVMRGGYCYCVKPFHGKVWKYDINQAYAAAMRDSKLPAGNSFKSMGRLHVAAQVYVLRITATNIRNKIPFYCRTVVDGKFVSVFARTEISDTWITSIEHEQLKREGWKITILESWCWETHFNMRDYVNMLETGRMTAEGGPSGPIGTTYKNIGNHSYGKTVEEIEPVEYIITQAPPEGFAPHYVGTSNDPLEHVYYRATEAIEKNYHQPQIGAFITSHVRMVIRRAAMIDPESWLYADTDCVVFSRDVTAELDIHPSRYGAWKVEDAGTDYKIIAKKVYLNTENNVGHAKGLNVKRLTPADFHSWFAGEAPTQEQVQRNNFIKVMLGAEMYRAQTRKGTDPQLEKKKAEKQALRRAKRVQAAMPRAENFGVS